MMFCVCLFSSACAASPVQFRKFKMVSMRSEDPIIIALNPGSQMFPQRCLWNSSNVRLTDDGPLSSFQGRSSSASSFHASLIDGVMFLALCSQVMSQAPQHFRSSETQATCDQWLFVPPPPPHPSVYLRSPAFSLTPACPEQLCSRPTSTGVQFRRWKSNINSLDQSVWASRFRFWLLLLLFCCCCCCGKPASHVVMTEVRKVSAKVSNSSKSSAGRYDPDGASIECMNIRICRSVVERYSLRWAGLAWR